MSYIYFSLIKHWPFKPNSLITAENLTNLFILYFQWLFHKHCKERETHFWLDFMKCTRPSFTFNYKSEIGLKKYCAVIFVLCPFCPTLMTFFVQRTLTRTASSFTILVFAPSSNFKFQVLSEVHLSIIVPFWIK